MREYEVLKIDAAPDWSAIPALKVDCVLWEPDCGIRMEQQLAWNEEALYVRQRAWEENVRAEHTTPLSAVCEDSCMEFFFAFGEDGRYFNFECNPNGCLYLGFGAKREERVRLIVKEAARKLELHTARLTDGWELRYCIPLSFLRVFYPELTLKPGLRFHANCYKCGDKTENPHYLAWNPVASETPDYHRPMDFGEMRLK